MLEIKSLTAAVRTYRCILSQVVMTVLFAGGGG
jgi:hypothetical protein